ncbi:LAME_0H20384g1_1 [Lachancea meyersii CBS 8951]|uniref:ER membrane protein complex subunit 4 n=1 Tax=Lachancea meyersii CBS 8951 TaxID=1266667 RepID=A0A1G4KJR8_9SACH|nr:LAME_0H20384g1_1 [Lachancea meyersii CBS 8951]
MTESIPQWATNLCDPDYAKKIQVKSSNSLASPPGFKAVGTSAKMTKNKESKPVQKQDLSALVVQKAWQIAMQPAKTIPMNMIVSYMSGTSLQIISIMTAVMFVSNPIKSIVNIRRTFKSVSMNPEVKSQVLMAMVMYVVFQVALMAIGVHKLNSMGLIPNTKSDWLFLEQPTAYKEKSFAF